VTIESFVDGLRHCTVFAIRALFLGIFFLTPSVSAFATMYEEPKSFSLRDKSQRVERKILPKIYTEPLLAEDLAIGKDPKSPRPHRFAVSANAAYTLDNSGIWQTPADGRLWRLRIQSPVIKNYYPSDAERGGVKCLDIAHLNSEAFGAFCKKCA
jgi:hypothetical protein